MYAETFRTSLPHASGKAMHSGLPERSVSPSRERGGIGIHVASGKVKSKVDVQYTGIATLFVAIRAVRYARIIKRSLNQRRFACVSSKAIFFRSIYISRSARPLHAPRFTLSCVNKIANLFDANHYM